MDTNRIVDEELLKHKKKKKKLRHDKENVSGGIKVKEEMVAANEENTFNIPFEVPRLEKKKKKRHAEYNTDEPSTPKKKKNHSIEAMGESSKTDVQEESLPVDFVKIERSPFKSPNKKKKHKSDSVTEECTPEKTKKTKPRILELTTALVDRIIWTPTKDPEKSKERKERKLDKLEAVTEYVNTNMDEEGTKKKKKKHRRDEENGQWEEIGVKEEIASANEDCPRHVHYEDSPFEKKKKKKGRSEEDTFNADMQKESFLSGEFVKLEGSPFKSPRKKKTRKSESATEGEPASNDDVTPKKFKKTKSSRIFVTPSDNEPKVSEEDTPKKNKKTKVRNDSVTEESDAISESVDLLNRKKKKTKQLPLPERNSKETSAEKNVQENVKTDDSFHVDVEANAADILSSLNALVNAPIKDISKPKKMDSEIMDGEEGIKMKQKKKKHRRDEESGHWEEIEMKEEIASANEDSPRHVHYEDSPFEKKKKKKGHSEEDTFNADMQEEPFLFGEFVKLEDSPFKSPRKKKTRKSESATEEEPASNDDVTPKKFKKTKSSRILGTPSDNESKVSEEDTPKKNKKSKVRNDSVTEESDAISKSMDLLNGKKKKTKQLPLPERNRKETSAAKDVQENVKTDDSFHVDVEANAADISPSLNALLDATIKDFSKPKQMDSESEENSDTMETGVKNVRAKSLKYSAAEKLFDDIELGERSMDESYAMLKSLNIFIPFEVPTLHMISSRFTNSPTPQQLKQIQAFDLKVKKGRFSKAEDDVILANFKEMCQSHDIPHNAGPFMHLADKKRVVLPFPERKKFIQYLARSLDDRPLSAVYQRFQALNSHHKKGKFSEEEDALILEMMAKRGDKKAAYIGRMLNRDRKLVFRRYCFLTRETDKSNKLDFKDDESKAEFIAELLRITGETDLQNLKDKDLPITVFREMSNKFRTRELNLNHYWNCTLHQQLFVKEHKGLNYYQKKLVNLLIEDNIIDFRSIDYTKYLQEFDGFTKMALNKVLRNLVYNSGLRKKYGDDDRKILRRLHRSLNAKKSDGKSSDA